MIDLYYWPTPNGHKITMFLEETGLPYEIHPINIGTGAQFAPEFLKISPNNRMPAIIDRAPSDGGEPLSVFESGAILVYLADKTGSLIPQDLRGRTAALEWVMWQMAGLGPMAGQNHHFSHYAPEKLQYAIDRYVNETNRLHGVLDRRLAQHTFLAGEQYSIADIAAYPWVVPWERQGQKISDTPHLQRWLQQVAGRPATQRAYALAENYKAPAMSDDAKKILFGQTAASVKQSAEQGSTTKTR